MGLKSKIVLFGLGDVFFPTPWWWLARSSGLNYSSCWQTDCDHEGHTVFSKYGAGGVARAVPASGAPAVQLLCMNRGACCSQVSMNYTCGQQELFLPALPTGKTPQTNSIFSALSSSGFLKPKVVLCPSCNALEVVWGSVKGKGNITCTFSLFCASCHGVLVGKAPFWFLFFQ